MKSGFGSIDDLLKQSKKIGQSAGSVSAPQITTAEKAEKLAEKMKEIEIKEKEKRAEAEAARSGLSYINLERFPIGPDTLSMISEEMARDQKTICFYRTTEEMRLATVNPNNPVISELIKDLENQFHSLISLYLISEHSLTCALKLYANIPKIKKVVRGVEITEADLEKYKQEISTFHDLENKIREVTLSEVVVMILAASIKARSSDIHIEAEEKGIQIRFRIDGILHDACTLAKESWDKITNRIKLLAGLKLNVYNKPQDGRFTIFLSKDKVDVRVSILPTTYGESIVIRLLMSSSVGLSFDKLGLQRRAFADLENEIQKPNGMIITTGPTGSGKTTTLYAILNKLNTPETKIITLEDPVEYKLEGINQSQVDYSRDYTFAKGLRSILRQDPDIVMVGEIRDLDTADVAINAALTGHLVISTLHTNSASGTIPRFISMGVKPFLLSPALNAIIGQRLVRKICEKCKEEVELDNQILSKVLEALKKIPAESAGKVYDFNNLKFYQGKGCDECQRIGYKGRVGIYEIMVMSKEIEQAISAGQVSEYTMQEIGIKQGMITMLQDGLLKATDGVTTVEEVFRVAK